METLTIDYLRSLGICQAQLSIFENLFVGGGTGITLEKVRRGVESGLQFDEFARKTFTPENLEALNREMFFNQCELSEQLKLIRKTFCSDKKIMNINDAVQKFNESQNDVAKIYNERISQVIYNCLTTQFNNPVE